MIFVASVRPRSFHPASRVKASCLPPMYMRAVSTSLYPRDWNRSRTLPNSGIVVTRAPVSVSVPKVMRPRITRGLGDWAMRGIVAVWTVVWGYLEGSMGG